jgi:RimJ/RimL family protein N-acetyltransferase
MPRVWPCAVLVDGEIGGTWRRARAHALQEFLQLEATRPLYAGAASDNAGSIRVLTKCGFVVVGEGRGFAYGRNEETDAVVLRLDA